MSHWIKVDWDFGVPWKRFTLSFREAAVGRMRKMLVMNQYTPALLAAEVEALIVEHRPELKGGSLVSIKMDWGRFEFLYSHPSLPKHTEHGSYPPEESLIIPNATTLPKEDWIGDWPNDKFSGVKPSVVFVVCPKCGNSEGIIDASQSFDCPCGHSW